MMLFLGCSLSGWGGEQAEVPYAGDGAWDEGSCGGKVVFCGSTGDAHFSVLGRSGRASWRRQSQELKEYSLAGKCCQVLGPGDWKYLHPRQEYLQQVPAAGAGWCGLSEGDLGPCLCGLW